MPLRLQFKEGKSTFYVRLDEGKDDGPPKLEVRYPPLEGKDPSILERDEERMLAKLTTALEQGNETGPSARCNELRQRFLVTLPAPAAFRPEQ